MRTFLINKANWPCGVSDGLTLECRRCGKSPKWDYTVKDDFWKKIIPKEWQRDVVCFECLEILADEKGVAFEIASNLESIQYTGKGFTIELIPANMFWYRKDQMTNEEFWETFREHIKLANKL